VIDLTPAKETGDAARTRAERRAYLTERGYKVCEVKAAEIERDVGKVLDRFHDLVGP
jgi:very-short-patch-repair endonuclease